MLDSTGGTLCQVSSFPSRVGLLTPVPDRWSHHFLSEPYNQPGLNTFGLSWWLSKNPPANAEMLVRSPGGGNGNPLQLFSPGEFHGQRSLAGYSPWGHKESDMT